jgi:hypothetical protein
MRRSDLEKLIAMDLAGEYNDEEEYVKQMLPSLLKDDASRMKLNRLVADRTYKPSAVLPMMPPTALLPRAKRHFSQPSRPLFDVGSPTLHLSDEDRPRVYAPWERPESRGALVEKQRLTARAHRISRSSMLYSKRSEELGYEAQNEGKTHMHFTGRLVFPLNTKSKDAKPPNPHDDSRTAPFAQPDYPDDKDRFVKLGSVKPLFSSPFERTPREGEHASGGGGDNDGNDRRPPTGEASDDALTKFLKFHIGEEDPGKRANQIKKEQVYNPSEHMVPKPPPVSDAPPSARARAQRNRKRQRNRQMQHVGQQSVEDGPSTARSVRSSVSVGRGIRSDASVATSYRSDRSSLGQHVPKLMSRPKGHRYNKKRNRHDPSLKKVTEGEDEENPLFQALQKMQLRKKKRQHHW